MKTLYIHIGMHKTATTTIQRLCFENPEVLERKNCSYPQFPFRYFDKSRERNGLFLNTRYVDKDGVRDEEIEEKWFLEGMDLVHKKFEEVDNIILSDEALWMTYHKRDCVNLKRIQEMSEEHGYRIKLIIYLRRQDKFIESWWNQRIKSFWTFNIPFDEFKESSQKDYLDYWGLLSEYAAIVGDENVIVKRFDEVIRSEGGIIKDFLNTIGLELTDEFFIDQDSNHGLYGNLVELKRVVNDAGFLEYWDNRTLRRGLDLVTTSSAEHYKCSEFSEEERTDYMSQFEEGNRKIADTFIKDGRPLFSLDYSGPEKRTNDNPEFLNDIVRFETGVTIQTYRETLEKIKAEDAKLKDTNARLNEKLKNTNAELNRTRKELQKEINALKKQNESQERRIEHLRHPLRYLIQKLKKLFGIK